MGENPKPSLAWKEPLIIEAFDGRTAAITNMYQYGLRIPGGAAFLRKRARLEGARDFEPGELVYFYAAKPLQTWFKREPGFWRGQLWSL